MAIDQNSPISLNEQVKADILRRIASGEFALGQKIPSLRSLAGEYEVAELTVHSAVKELQYEGVLESSTGRGTFVRALPTGARTPTNLAAEVASLRAAVEELRDRVSAIEDAQGRS